MIAQELPNHFTSRAHLGHLLSVSTHFWLSPQIPQLLRQFSHIQPALVTHCPFEAHQGQFSFWSSHCMKKKKSLWHLFDVFHSVIGVSMSAISQDAPECRIGHVSVASIPLNCNSKTARMTFAPRNSLMLSKNSIEKRKIE